MYKLSSFLPLLAVLTALFTSCQGEPKYAPQLVEADSLIMHGEYASADSLLSDYDSNNDKGQDAASHYRLLLQMGRLFVDDQLTVEHFSVVDSLCRYYNRFGSRDKYGKALCYLGSVYQNCGDYPSALRAYLKATHIAENCNDCHLLGWLCRNKGDLYFVQGMFEECKEHYRKYYNIAVANNDTLRMALASFSMGRLQTILSDVDSIEYYYKNAIELGRKTKKTENIVPYARFQLSDLYIQIEKFEEARLYMTRDSLNDINWAYWHLGQNHTDSAAWYFKKTFKQLDHAGQLEVVRILAQIEERKDNIPKALHYYKMVSVLNDSVAKSSQVDDIRRINTQFNLELIKQERNQIAEQSRYLSLAILFITCIVIASSFLIYYIWKSYKNQKNKEMAQEKLLRQLEQEKYRHSISQLKDNERKIALLEEQLTEALSHKDTASATGLELSTKQLKMENLNIEANQRRQQYLLEMFLLSPLYIKIKKHAGEESFHLKNEEWDQLGESIDEVFNNFTQRLLMLVQLSDVELKTCYLIKLEVTPADIATMLYKSKAAITMLRQRLYKKITQKKGTAKQLDEFILNF